MKMFIALILVFPFFAFAKDADTKSQKKVDLFETKVPVKEGYETMNMNEFKGLNNPTSTKSGLKFSQGCKSKTGVEYKESDSGYEGCLREAQADHAQGTNNGASPNMGFKIGD